MFMFFLFLFVLLDTSNVRCQPAIAHLQLVLEKSSTIDNNQYLNQQDSDQSLLSSIYDKIPNNANMFIESGLHVNQQLPISREKFETPINSPSWLNYEKFVGQQSDFYDPKHNQETKPVYQVEFEIIKDDNNEASNLRDENRNNLNNQPQITPYSPIDNFEESGSNFYSEDFMNNQVTSTKINQPESTSSHFTSKNNGLVILNGVENKTNSSFWSANNISTTLPISSTYLYINQTKPHVDVDLNNSTTRKIDSEADFAWNKTTSKFISKIKSFSDKIAQMASSEKPIEDLIQGKSNHLSTVASTHSSSKSSSGSLKEKKSKNFFKSEPFDELYDIEVLPRHHAILNRKFKQHFVEKRVHNEQQAAKDDKQVAESPQNLYNYENNSFRDIVIWISSTIFLILLIIFAVIFCPKTNNNDNL